MASSSLEPPPSQQLPRRPTGIMVADPHVIVYDQVKGELNTMKETGAANDTRCVEIDLPVWSIEVEIYVDNKAKSGLITLLKLDKLGRSVNWQRHVKRDYVRMYVKNPRTDEEGYVLEEEVEAHGGVLPFVVSGNK